MNHVLLSFHPSQSVKSNIGTPKRLSKPEINVVLVTHSFISRALTSTDDGSDGNSIP